MKRRVAALTVVHDFAWSRDQVQPGFFTERERAEYPPVRHGLVRANPVNGHRALFMGAHASHIEGMSVARRRPRHLGQPIRLASRDTVRQRAPQAFHAAHDHLRRSRRAHADHERIALG
jgi:hypothetical protein